MDDLHNADIFEKYAILTARIRSLEAERDALKKRLLDMDLPLGKRFGVDTGSALIYLRAGNKSLDIREGDAFIDFLGNGDILASAKFFHGKLRDRIGERELSALENRGIIAITEGAPIVMCQLH